MKPAFVLALLIGLATSLAQAQNLECRGLFTTELKLASIDGLGSGAPLPVGLLYGNSTVAVAEAAVMRVAKRIASQPKPRIPYPLQTHSQLMLFFQPEASADIAKGGFLNYFQTGRSAAWLSRDLRKAAEDRMLDLHLADTQDQKSPVNELRPKYVFLNLTAPLDVGPHSGDARTYGRSEKNGASAAIVFKDEIKRRATWTGTDSLLAPINAAHAGTFYENSLPVGPMIPDSYFEGQIYGELKAEHGQAVLLFTDPNSWGSEKNTALEQLKALGLPIYSGITHFQFSRVIYLPGELLWTPPSP